VRRVTKRSRRLGRRAVGRLAAVWLGCRAPMAKLKLRWRRLGDYERRMIRWCYGLAAILFLVGLCGDHAGWWSDHSYLLNLTSSATAFAAGLPVALILYRRLGPRLERNTERRYEMVERAGNALQRALEEKWSADEGWRPNLVSSAFWDAYSDLRDFPALRPVGRFMNRNPEWTETETMEFKLLCATALRELADFRDPPRKGVMIWGGWLSSAQEAEDEVGRRRRDLAWVQRSHDFHLKRTNRS
jgi:hypothetical protein